jgi:hypothetical protein
MSCAGSENPFHPTLSDNIYKEITADSAFAILYLMTSVPGVLSKITTVKQLPPEFTIQGCVA